MTRNDRAGDSILSNLASWVPERYFRLGEEVNFRAGFMNSSDKALETQVVSEKAMLYILDLEEHVNRKESNLELNAKLEERKTARSKLAQSKELQAEMEELVSRNAKTLSEVAELQDALTKVQLTMAEADEDR